MIAPLRVLMVVEPGIDGVFRHVEGLIHFCCERGVEVHLAYSDRRGSERLTALLREVGACGGTCLNLEVGNAPEPRDISAFLRLLQLVRKVRPQVIHAHSSKAGALARSLRWCGIQAPLFYTPHAYYGLAPQRAFLGRAFYNAVEQLLGRIGQTIAVSHDEAAFAEKTLKVPAERIVTIPNPVETDAFQPATVETRRELRARFSLPEDAIILGAMGRLSFQKNPQLLYRALAPLFAEEPALRLWHVGQGNLQPELQELAKELGISERIHRTSYLSEPQGFYQAIDALALTSRYEGCPIVVLEALSCDLPLIVSEAPGTSDFAQAGLSHCWMAPGEDVVGFAQAVRAFLDDRRQGRRSNHRDVARERFSVESCFGAVLECYRKVLP